MRVRTCVCEKERERLSLAAQFSPTAIVNWTPIPQRVEIDLIGPSGERVVRDKGSLSGELILTIRPYTPEKFLPEKWATETRWCKPARVVNILSVGCNIASIREKRAFQPNEICFQSVLKKKNHHFFNYFFIDNSNVELSRLLTIQHSGFNIRFSWEMCIRRCKKSSRVISPDDYCTGSDLLWRRRTYRR